MFCEIVLAILNPLNSHINFRISLSISEKNAFRDFDWDSLEPIGQFGRIDVLTTHVLGLLPLSHQCFHTSFVKFIPTSLILHAIVYVLLFFFFRLFAISWAALAVCGGFQARGPIGAVAAGLCQSHSNARSEPHLRPIPQLTATPDP